MPPKKPQAGGKAAPAPVKTEGSAALPPAAQPAASAPVSLSSTPAATPAPPSRSGSTAPPSSSAHRKPVLAPKPKFTGRRSATARAELEAAEAKKKEAEAAAAAEQARKDAKDARKFGYRGPDRGARGGARGGRGRGGHMGDAHRQRPESQATGVFGGGQASAETRGGWGRSGGGGGGGRFGGGGGGGGPYSGFGSGAASRSAYSSGGVGAKPEHDVDMGGMRPVKAEEEGYISSEEEDEAQVGPKQNIDQLQVIDLTGDGQGPEDPFAPVRLGRLPHKERAVGLVVEEDSPESGDVPEAVSEKRKGKQKAKDVEVTGSSAIPKRPTTYSSSETEDGDPPIKKESTEDEHQTRPRTPDPATTEPATEMTSRPHDLPVSPESRRRAKTRIKEEADALDDDLSDFEIPDPPRFQTQAEKDEWVRQYDDLRQIRKEFGRQVPRDTRPPDAEGDTAMAEATAQLEKLKAAEEERNNHVYIFQFPPVLPDLVPVSVKPDPDSAAAHGPADAMRGDRGAGEHAQTTDAAPDVATSKHPQPKLPSGHVGKLRVRRSGKADLDWGGTSLVLGKGADATFLQNVFLATVPDTKPGEDPAHDPAPAVAMGLGQIRGKFVFTPDWERMLT